MRLHAIALTFVLVACSKDAAEITKQYRPKAEPRMQKLTAAIQEYPSVEKAPIDKLRFGGDQPNALLALASWFDDSTDTVTPVIDGTHVRGVMDALRGAEPIPSSYNYEPDFKAFLAAKYVVTVSVSAPPVILPDGTVASPQGKGVIQIYEIDSGKKRERLEVTASSNDTVLVAEGKEAQGVAADMLRNLSPKMNEAIAPYLATGEKPPF